MFFICAMERIFHLSPHENILTIALINIHYLYNNTLGPKYHAVTISQNVFGHISKMLRFKVTILA